MILYAIAMADYDQENTEVSKDVLKTKDGINRLALYNSSVGRLVVELKLCLVCYCSFGYLQLICYCLV